jgi:hypothetical protein
MWYLVSVSLNNRPKSPTLLLERYEINVHILDRISCRKYWNYVLGNGNASWLNEHWTIYLHLELFLNFWNIEGKQLKHKGMRAFLQHFVSFPVKFKKLACLIQDVRYEINVHILDRISCRKYWNYVLGNGNASWLNEHWTIYLHWRLFSDTDTRYHIN